MLVHRPTHQAVRMLSEFLVTLRNEGLTTSSIYMIICVHVNYVSLNRARGEHESTVCLCFVEYSVPRLPLARRISSALPHEGHLSAVNLDPLVDPQLLVPAAARLLPALLENLARTNIDSLPLIIKPATLVDVVQSPDGRTLCSLFSSLSPTDLVPPPMRQPGHFRPAGFCMS